MFVTCAAGYRIPSEEPCPYCGATDDEACKLQPDEDASENETSE